MRVDVTLSQWAGEAVLPDFLRARRVSFGSRLRFSSVLTFGVLPRTFGRRLQHHASIRARSEPWHSDPAAARGVRNVSSLVPVQVLVGEYMCGLAFVSLPIGGDFAERQTVSTLKQRLRIGHSRHARVEDARR